MTNGVIVQFTLTTMDLSVNKPIEYNLLIQIQKLV